MEAAKELPAQGVQKPPRGVGKKQFSGGFLAAPAAVVKKPVGLKTRPAWKQLDRLGWWWLVWPSHLGLVVCRRVGAVEVACLLTQIKGLDQRINNLGIKRDRANRTWTQCKNTLCFETEYTLQLYHQYRLYPLYYVYLYLHTHIPTLMYE